MLYARLVKNIEFIVKIRQNHKILCSAPHCSQPRLKEQFFQNFQLWKTWIPIPGKQNIQWNLHFFVQLSHLHTAILNELATLDEMLLWKERWQWELAKCSQEFWNYRVHNHTATVQLSKPTTNARLQKKIWFFAKHFFAVAAIGICSMPDSSKRKRWLVMADLQHLMLMLVGELQPLDVFFIGSLNAFYIGSNNESD